LRAAEDRTRRGGMRHDRRDSEIVRQAWRTS
jgi:hypothetical protein